MTDISNSMFRSSFQNKKHVILSCVKISVLSWFSKILEKCMYKRSIKFSDKHNIISESLESN